MDGLISIDDLFVRKERDRWTITYENSSIDLRPPVGLILEILVQTASDKYYGPVLSHAEILGYYASFQGSSPMKSYPIIHELREALGEPLRDRIKTHRGEGY